MSSLLSQFAHIPSLPWGQPNGRYWEWPIGKSPTNRIHVVWMVILGLICFGGSARAQTIPSSVTVSGACLSGTYALAKVVDSFEGTGRPAYNGLGTVAIDGTTYSGVSLLLYYEPAGPAWVLAFDGQPYQSNPSTATLPPMTGWVAVTDGVVGTCSGSITVSYVTPTVSLAVSASSVCAGSPFSLTATPANFSGSVTSYSLSSNPSVSTMQGTPGVFTGTAPNVSTPTVYSFTITAANSSGTASNTAVITVNPLPTQYTVTGGGAYCMGGLGVAVGLSGSQMGVNYQLLRGGSAVGSPVAGTGNAISFGNQTTAGAYTVQATTASTSCQQTMSGSVAVTVNPLPTQFSVTGGGAYCMGGSGVVVGLSGSQTGVNYQLLRGGSAVGSAVAGTGNALSFGNQTVAGTYTVQATNSASNCQQTMTGSAVVTTSPLPTAYNVTGGGAYCAGGSGVVVGLSGSQTGVNYQLLRDGNAVGSAVAGTGNALSFGNQTTGGTYTAQATNTSTTCQQTMTGSAVVTVNPLPTAYTVTGGGTYCQGGSGASVGLSGSQAGINYQLRRDGANVGSPVAGNGSALNFGNQTVAGTYTVQATNTTTTCQQTMTGSALITITPLPDAPNLVTASGYSYPAGQSSLTISQSVGPVSLTATGCSGGIITANGSSASSFTISTAMTGTQTYTATCTQNGCTGPAGSFRLTVLPTTLGVLHRDADYGATTNNIIKPYLQLSNASNEAIPYSQITVRYWLTPEGSAPTNFAVYYAPLGAVQIQYVTLSQPRQGATGYVEYSFPGGGNLPAQGNSGPIENGIQKADGSNFNESDDYSYMANYADYVPNTHITAYRNGVIFWGQEPALVAAQQVVKVYSAAKDGPTTSQIQTRVEVRNEGNTSITVSNLKVRYYFTSDNGQLANVYVDYADIGASNVQAQVVQLGSPVNGADSYVELTFVGSSLVLAPQSSLGAVDFRIVRSDYGLLDQTNDYSYAANYGNVGLNAHITAYLSNSLVFGTPPTGGSARVAAVESSSLLKARVLGNPVVGTNAEVEITGAAGQSVGLMLVDLQGRTLHQQRIEQADAVERVSVPLGQSRGQLLLKVSTANQQQQLKLLRP